MTISSTKRKGTGTIFTQKITIDFVIRGTDWKQKLYILIIKSNRKWSPLVKRGGNQYCHKDWQEWPRTYGLGNKYMHMRNLGGYVWK